ncbi:MAG: tetratricopeptide repeat protein [Bryobacteraceae bacterium]
MVFLTFLALAFLGTAQQSPVAETATSHNFVETAPTAKIPPPHAPISAEMRGDIFMARKMYREAIDAYQQGGGSAVLVNKIGIAYHQLLEFKTAKKYYERAIRIDPKYSEAVNNLGTIYYATKSYRRAIKQYKKALRLNPNSASIYSNLGTGYFARRKYKRAAEAYQQALALDPNVF